MNPKLSIIIPSYNNADKLSTLLDSIKAQQFESFEVLVIDGNSQDHTKEIISRYASLINYFVSENDDGIYDAMNKGIKASSGEWLYFIGCDDTFYSPFTLKKVFEYEDESIKILYGKIFNSKKQKVEGKQLNKIEDLIHTSIWHQSVFYRKELFDQFGLYNTQYKIAADVVFNLSTFSQIFNQLRFTNIIVSVFSGYGISSQLIDLEYHKNQKTLFKKWFSNVDESLIYIGLQHHLYNQIKLGNYIAAFFEYSIIFLKTKDRFTILKHALYYLTQHSR